MPKYEIMMVVDGTIKESDASKIVNDFKTILKDAKDFKVDNWGLVKTKEAKDKENLKISKDGLIDLAYPIKKKNKAYYFILNFYTENTESIKEFRRVVLLKNQVLRHLIINLEKDYGYKAKVNPKKVMKSNFRSERYKRIKEQTLAEQERIRKEREKDTTPVKLTDI
ncbi:MAG: 30S ribosomal protein S6 [Malacoplasma sp.]|nr:30S ribosomal protein S6 [Malacoplasma sp.]